MKNKQLERNCELLKEENQQILHSQSEKIKSLIFISNNLFDENQIDAYNLSKFCT